MDKLPHRQGRAQEIGAMFVERYRDDIPPTGYELLKNGKPRWDKEINWCRYECVQNGLMDSPKTGIWRITEKGRQHLLENQVTPSNDWHQSSEALKGRKAAEANLGDTQTTKEEWKEVSMLRKFGDFLVPLMKILDSLPNWAGQSGDILRIFGETYREQIDPDLYKKNPSGRIRWEINVYWIREKLKSLGFLDAPQYGVWRLTERGHQWLMDNPAATHLTAEKPKSSRRVKTASFAPQQKETASGFLMALHGSLQVALKKIFGSIHYELRSRGNSMQIRMAGFSGCHYEIALGRQKHEIALHFESSAERSHARLRVFEPQIGSLSQALNMPIYSGDLGSRGWTQVYIETPLEPLTVDLTEEYVDLVERFVAATFPILKIEYGGKKTAHTATSSLETFPYSHPMYAILDQEVLNIRLYLEGRSSIPISDEKLCDWVNFCYIFELYSEGRGLFSFIDGAEVNPWYFERTKRIARVCEQKKNLFELRKE
jgi:restriction endonuclease Mrr